MGISLNLELMLLVFVLFILSIFLLNKWLYQPVLNFMDARDNMIKNDLENANSNDSSIETIHNEINDILQLAKKEATEIKEQAIEKAKLEYNKQIDEEKSANEKDLAIFLESLQGQKDELKKSLLLQIPEFQKSLSNKLKQI